MIHPAPKPAGCSGHGLNRLLALIFLLAACCGQLASQEEKKPAAPQRQNRSRTFIIRKVPLAGQFDADRNGSLSYAERQEARAHIRKTRSKRRWLSGLKRLTTPGATTAFPQGLLDSKDAPEPETSLYDESRLRTIHLKFPREDWYEELGDFFLTDVDLPADLAMDGVLYPEVGIRFRGKSSYYTIGKSEKRSFNISVDFTHKKQRIHGYRTLNLLNCHADPTFLREILYSRICRDYMPCARASFIKLFINGESWGIYVNLQQFNSDFLRDWFGTPEGVRWKIPGRRPAAAFNWNGPDSSKYSSVYELKGSSVEQPWGRLIEVCEALEKTRPGNLEQKLAPIFNIDRALWFLALENIFMDNDSYVAKASDYAIYQDGLHGRIHLLQQDGSEPFGVSSPEWNGDGTVSPVLHEGNPARPLIHRLLAVPHLRARYLAHYKTIIRDWLSRESIVAVIDPYLELVAHEIAEDRKKIFSQDFFEQNLEKDVQAGRLHISGLFSFIDKRREFLLSHPEIDKPAPGLDLLPVSSTRSKGAEAAGKRIRISVRVFPAPKVDRVLLHYCTDPEGIYKQVEMNDDAREGDLDARDSIYSALLPPSTARAVIRYYVEARALDSAGTSSFEPSRAEARPHHFTVPDRRF